MSNIEGVKRYIKKNGIRTEEELCEVYIKESMAGKAVFRENLPRWLAIEQPGRAYYNIYKKYILKGKLLDRYYDEYFFTKEELKEKQIMYKGNDESGAFSGVTVKEEDGGWYHIWLRDGAKGVMLSKTYKGLPKKERVIRDSIFELCDTKLRKKEKGMTLEDIFKEKAERECKYGQTNSAGNKGLSLQYKGIR